MVSSHSVLRPFGGEVRPWRRWIGDFLWRQQKASSSKRARPALRIASRRLRRTRGAVADCQGPIVDGSGALGIRFHDLWATDKNHKVDNFFAYSRRGAVRTLETLADACRGPGARLL